MSKDISIEKFKEVMVELFFEHRGHCVPEYGYLETGLGNFGFWSWALIDALTSGECSWYYFEISCSIEGVEVQAEVVESLKKPRC